MRLFPHLLRAARQVVAAAQRLIDDGKHELAAALVESTSAMETGK